MPYRTTRQADEDIITVYLEGCSKFGRLQAERYQEGLARTLDVIFENPRIARERVEFDPPVRLHPYGTHLIAYLLDDDGVLIVRVIHGRADRDEHL